MDAGDPHDEIERLEERIERLTARIESCRKFAAAARLAIAFGAALLVLLLLGVIPFDPLALTAAIAAMLGGVVLLGSNGSTAKEAAAEMAEAEQERAGLIGRIDFRVIDDRHTVH